MAAFDPGDGFPVRFEITGPGSTASPGFGTTLSGAATFTYTSTALGADSIVACSDESKVCSDVTLVDVPISNTVIKTWVHDLALSPATALNVVGEDHTVAATVDPVTEGINVRFEIIAGPNDTDTTVDLLTDASGVATFTYDGTGGFGVDTIQPCIDLGADGCDLGASTHTVFKTWVDVKMSGGLQSPPRVKRIRAILRMASRELRTMMAAMA